MTEMEEEEAEACSEEDAVGAEEEEEAEACSEENAVREEDAVGIEK